MVARIRAGGVVGLGVQLAGIMIGGRREVRVQVDSLVMGTGAGASAGLDEGRMSFPLVLLLCCRLAGNKHLRPRLIPASSQTVVIQLSGLDGTSCIITTTTTTITSTTTTTLTTMTKTSIPPTLK